MKFRVCSDLHLDHYTVYGAEVSKKSMNELFFLPVIDGEKDQTLIIAGDFLSPPKVEYWAQAVNNLSNRFKEILVVLGNHDYWFCRLESAAEQLKEAFKGFENVVVLDDEWIEREGVHIFGGTLWTDFNGANPYNMWEATERMNDYLYIYTNRSIGLGRAQANDTYLRHLKTLRELELGLPKEGRKVIITHHLPTYQSITGEWRGDSLNPAYASNLNSFIEKVDADLWVHGHVHTHNDYFIGKTRMVSNPAGYFNQKNTGYEPDLVVEI